MNRCACESARASDNTAFGVQYAREKILENGGKAARTSLYVLAVIMFICVAVPRLCGQSASAELEGTVKDASGAVIPSTTLSVKNVSSGAVRTSISNSSGIFDFPDLPPSLYEVTVSASGFASQRLTNIRLAVGSQQVLNVTLTPSAVVSTVEVSGAAPPIELASSSVGGVENAQTIQELPLNGRDWTQLATLQPGTSSIRTQQSLNSTSSRGSRGFGSDVSLGGTRPSQNNYFVDGISENDYSNEVPGNVTGVALGVDAIQEFAVVTSSFDATYCCASGGVVNAITRSGSNEFHGDAYEFLRNDILDARNFFDVKKPPFRRNQFGVAAGAPIVRNKLFVFSNYEGLRQSLSTTAVATVPSVAARAGNLSTGKVTISPVIQPYLALWQLPNGALLGAGDTGQYLFSARSPSSENAGTIKLDDLISGKDSLAAFYSVDDGSTSLPDALNTIFIDSTLRRNTASISELHIFNPQLLNAFRMGMNRVTAHALNSSPGNNPAASDASLGVLPGRDAPVLVVPGLTTFGGGVGGPAFSNFWVTNFQFYDDLSIQKGRHAIKVGGDFVRYRFNIQLSNTPNGQYSFNSLSDFLTNQKLTTFLADVFFSGSQVSPVGTAFPERGFRQSIFGGYAQDNIRVLPNLTINLGFRYEAATVPGEVNNLTGNLRDIYSINLNPGKQLFQNPTHFDFAPRVGLAWDPFKDGQTSIRAAYGFYDVLPLAFELAALEGNSGPFANAVSIANPPAGSFPHGGYNQILALGPSSVPVREPSIEYNPRRNYVMQWNTSVQRTLVPDLTLLVAYAGSHGVHMTGLYNDANIVTPTLTPQGYLWPTPIGSGTKLNPTLGAIRQLTWGGSAVYDSLQTRIQRRFRHGLQLTGSFTWQKALDDVSSTSFTNQFQNSVNPLIIDRHLIRGPSDFNVARVAVISGIWELPRSKSSPAAVQAVVNGWQMGGIFTVSDGLPFTALISGDPAGEKNSFAYDTPNRVVGPACTHLTNPGNPNGYINLSCFSFPVPANLFGNAGRNSLVGPGLAELDFSIMRNFRVPLSESGRLQFRAEAFNLANRANFQGPVSNNSLYNASGAPLATAGVITSTATTSRQIQFALRLLW